MRHHRPKSRHQLGIALITALMLVSVMSVLLGGIGLISIMNYQYVGGIKLKSAATIAAEGGLSMAEAFVSQLFYAGLYDNTAAGVSGAAGAGPESACGGDEGLDLQFGPTLCVKPRLLPPYSHPESAVWPAGMSNGRPDLKNTLDNPEYVFRYLDSYFDLPRVTQVVTDVPLSGAYQRFVVWPSQAMGSGLRYRTLIVATRYARQPTLGDQYSRSITIKVVGATVRGGTNPDDFNPGAGRPAVAPLQMTCANTRPEVVLTRTLVFQVQRRRGYAAPHMRLHPDYLAAEIDYHPPNQRPVSVASDADIKWQNPDPNVFWYNDSLDQRNHAFPIAPNPYTTHGIQAAATLVSSTSDFFFITYAFRNLLGREPTLDEVTTWMRRINYRVGESLNVSLAKVGTATSPVVAGGDSPTSATLSGTAPFLPSKGDLIRLRVPGPGPETGDYFAVVQSFNPDTNQVTWLPPLKFTNPLDGRVNAFNAPLGTRIDRLPLRDDGPVPADQWKLIPGVAPVPASIRMPGINPNGAFPDATAFDATAYVQPFAQAPAAMPTPAMPSGAPPPDGRLYPQFRPDPSPNPRPSILPLGYDSSRPGKYYDPTNPDNRSYTPPDASRWPPQPSPSPDRPDWPFMWPAPLTCATCSPDSTLPVLSVLPGGQYPPIVVRQDPLDRDKFHGLYQATNPYRRYNDLVYTLLHAYPAGAGVPDEPSLADCAGQPPSDRLNYLWHVRCGRVREIEPVDSLIDQTFLLLQDQSPFRLRPSTRQIAPVTGFRPADPLAESGPPFNRAVFPPSMQTVLTGSAAKCLDSGGVGCTYELFSPVGVSVIDPATLEADDWVWENVATDHYQLVGGQPKCCGGTLSCEGRESPAP